jgi:hypothetical protein
MRGGGATASYNVNVFTDGCDCPSPSALCKHVLAARLKYATLFGQDPSRDCELYQLVPNLNELLGRPTTSSQRAPTGSWARGLSAASATTLREIDAILPADALRELTALFDNVSLHGEELLRQLKDNVQEDAGLPGGRQPRSLPRRRALLRLASTAMAANAAIVTEATGCDPIGAVHGKVRQPAATNRDEVAARTAAAPPLRVPLASSGSMQALAASASAADVGEHAPPAAGMPLRPGASVHAPTQHHQSRLGLGPAALRAHNVTAAVAPATVAAAAAAATVAATSASATTSLGNAGAGTTPAAATSAITVTSALAPPAFVGAPASAASAAVPPVEVTTQVPASAAAAASGMSRRKRERDESHGGDGGDGDSGASARGDSASAPSPVEGGGAPFRRVRARRQGAVPESVGSVPLQLPPPPLHAPPPALHAPPPALHAPPPVLHAPPPMTPPPPSAAAMARAQVACIKCSARGAWRDTGDGKVVCICGYVAVWETFEVSAGAYVHDTSCNIVQRLK